MDRAELEGLDRESLVSRAQAAGIRRARILTRPELVDELLRLDPDASEAQLRRSRGFFGRARDLLTRVVERGLHLPDAADRLRAALSTPMPEVPRPPPQAVPTVTLAEIYAAQGHKDRAIETLERVLEADPEHAAARTLLDRLNDAAYVAPAPRDLPPEEQPPAAVAAECIAIPSGGGRVYVWWQAGAALDDERFVVRVVSLEPTWDGPRERIEDVVCDPAAGETVVSGIPEPAVVRVAVGFIRGGVLVPLAHSPAFEISPRGGDLVRWTLDGFVPVVLDDPRFATIARAVEGARRALGVAAA